MTTSKRSLRWVLALLVLVVATWFGSNESLRQPTPSPTTAPLTWANLPAEGQRVGRLIAQGGPFPFEKDGTVFGNRERLLPPH